MKSIDLGSGIRPALLVLAVSAGLLLRADNINDFNAGTLPGWGTFDLTPVLNSLEIPGSYADYSFPADGHGGKAFRVSTPTLPSFLGDQAGPPRAFAFPKTAYSRFRVQADVLAWNNTNDQAFGFLFLASSIGPGTTDGYVLNYNVRGGDLQINTVTGEAPGNDAVAETHLPMDPSKHTYRWELSGYDGNLLARVFQFPDTQNPIGSVIGTDSSSTSGVIGLFNYDRADPPYLGTDSTFDNYVATAPAPGSLTPVVAFLSPVPGSTVTLAQPVISAAVLDRETVTDRSSFRLAIDGIPAPTGQLIRSDGVTAPNNPVPFQGVTLTYAPAVPLTAGQHQVQLVYADNRTSRFTNTWTFTAAYLTEPMAGTPGPSGFNVFVVQAPQDPQLPNLLASADAQLATNSTIPRLYVTNVVAPYINYDARAFAGTSSSIFGNDLPLPGQMDANTVRNWALRATAYLQLPAGVVTLGVKHDDGFRVTYGDLVLGEFDGGTGDHPFSFYVAKAGLYPLTLEWNQSGGSAYVDWYQSTPGAHDDTANEVLLNTYDGYRAYTWVISPPQLLSSTTLRGPLSPVANATYDEATLTFTVPLEGSGPTRFYRVSASGRGNVAEIRIVGANVLVRYLPAP